MLALIPPATLLWDRGGRIVLLAAYGLTACLGVLGITFHSEGHLLQRLVEVFSVWWSTLQTGAVIKALHSPLLAPAASMGLGSIGILFSINERPVIDERQSVDGISTRPPLAGIVANDREVSGLERGRLEAVLTSVRIEDSVSARDFLNFPMPCPSDCPSSGNRLGPKITMAIPRIRAISGGLHSILCFSSNDE
jgi:hypothetical protein